MKTDAKPVRSRLFFLVGLLALLGAAGVVWFMLNSRRTALAEDAQARLHVIKAGPAVSVAPATRSPEGRTLRYVGETRPYATVTLYAKVSGYVQEVAVDKGDKVTRGQRLAVIYSPELDRQYQGALADAKNKKADLDRARQLSKSGAMSPQNYERLEAVAQVAEEQAAALLVQKNYQEITAPFDGTITARFVDRGALVQSATSSQTNALPLFTLSQLDRLRVSVYVDQRSAALIQVADAAIVTDAARTDVQLKGKVARFSGDLDPKTRTMLVEVDLDNTEGKILANSFVRVALDVKTPSFVQILAAALVMRGNSSFAAILEDDNIVAFHPIEIQESDGKMVQLRSGVTEGENVILNPGDTVTEGQAARPMPHAGAGSSSKR